MLTRVSGGRVRTGVRALYAAIVHALDASPPFRQHQRAWWCGAARAAGLVEVVEGSGFLSKTLFTARTGDLHVHAERYAAGQGEHGTRIVIQGDSGLSLRPSIADSSVEVLGTGEDRFDAEMAVNGDLVVARAVLDVQTRRMLRLLVDGRLPVAAQDGGLPARVAVLDGAVRIETVSAWDTLLRDHLAEALALPLALARSLQRPASIPGRLAENTRTEPDWSLRRENLRVLAGTFPNHSATREALRRGSEDAHQEVRLQAALDLFDATGQETLLELASSESSGDAVAAKAIAALGRALPAGRALPILAHALRTRRLQAAAACVTLLGETLDAPVVETLANVVRAEGGAVAVAAAKALGRASSEAAEPALIDALATDEHAVRLAAIRSLGRVGTPVAVLPLREAGGNDAVLLKATREAIARIQARGSGVPGQVSLAEGAEGQVSLADHEPRGRVSLDKPD